MIQLYSKQSNFLRWSENAEVFVARVTTNPRLPSLAARDCVLLVSGGDYVPLRNEDASKFKAVITTDPGEFEGVTRVIELEQRVSYVSDDDILRIDPQKKSVRVVFRHKSMHNSLLMTETCNSFCLMCSQPPRLIDDSYLIKEIKKTIELIPRDTHFLCLSGGEPTLCGDGFFEVIRCARNNLPETELQVLTNGRKFADVDTARRLGQIGHPWLRLGIPLYSAQPDQHDFVVQSKGAFDQTIKGLLNLSLEHVRIELRVVLHRFTYERLPELAYFIGRNLPFVDHVALMGLELTGFAKVNSKSLWIDPYEYRNQLKEAVRILDGIGVPVRIFNHQLCVVDEAVRNHCVASISDWKNDYLSICDSCEMRHKCGGFFSSGIGLDKHSEHIHPLKDM